MSFPNQSFNDNKIVIKMTGGKEKLYNFFGEEKMQNERFNKNENIPDMEPHHHSKYLMLSN